MATNFGRQTASGHLTVSAESKEPYAADVEAQLREDSAAIIARYPQKRSALLPMLHLVQSVDGYVSGRGIELCAELLDLETAEVSGVATFYTQYKRHPNGEYTVGVCTNTLCAIMGGDRIWDEVSAHLGIGHDETTPDGRITLERVECNAACDFAPVVMANWEFFDNQTPQSTKQLVDDLRAGNPVRPTRGPDRVCSFKEVSRTLAGFSDGLADEGVGAGPASLVGLELAHQRGWVAPGEPGSEPEAVPVPDEVPAIPPTSGDEAPADDALLPPPHVDERAVDQAAVAAVEPPEIQLESKSATGRPVPTPEPEPVLEPDDDAILEDAAAPAGSYADAVGASAAPVLPVFDEVAAGVAARAATGEEPPAGTEPAAGDGWASPGPDGKGPEGWTVKGKADAKVFHTEDSPWYRRTKADVWFRDAEAAAAAGFTDALHGARTDSDETDGKGES